MIARTEELLRNLQQYETAYPLAFPWNADEEEKPRYFRDSDGWWRAPSAQKTGKALIACTGDLMCEPRMTRANQYGSAMFFHPLFQFVRGILRGADFTIGNLETTVTAMTPYAGQYHTVAAKYHCNAPVVFLDALRYAGFDAFVNANNHNCDSAVAGLMDTNFALDRYGFMHTGTFQPAQKDRALLVEVCGIKIGIVSYATYFNKLETYFTQEGREQMLNAFAPEKAVRDVAWARAQGAEFILSYIHWGKSYVHEPTDIQREQARALADAGVDCIVGSHSHCLQIEETVTAADGRQVPVIYSMGNFVTNESQDLCRHCGVLQLGLEKTELGIRLTRWFAPCYVFDEFGTGRYACVPADPLYSGGYDHPEQQRNRDFVKSILPNLSEPVSGGMTLAQVCALWGVEMPENLAAASFARIQSQAQRPCDRALHFSAGGEEKFLQLQLRRYRPVAVVTESPVENQPCILVPDVKAAYLALCRAIRSRFSAKVVTVAGTSFKTATRSALCRVLGAKGRVLTHDDGVAIDEFCCLHLHPTHDFCVQELRQDHALGMDTALQALSPQVCVITTELPELSRLVSVMAPGTALVFNAGDDALVSALHCLDTAGLTMIPYTDGPTGAAAACGEFLGVTNCAQSLKNWHYEGMEHNVFRCGGVTVLTDYACKSASAASATAKTLSACGGKKIALAESRYLELFRNADVIIPVEELPAERDDRLAYYRQLEDRLLAELEPGSAVALCGRRELDLNVVLRRVFGLTDGVITDLW